MIKYHNQRITEINKRIEKEHAEYYQHDFVALVEEHKGYKRRYDTSTHDFLYWTLNMDVIKAFMRKTKYKLDQFTTDNKLVHYYFSHLC